MKTQRFGIEIEMTGITREVAAQVANSFLGIGSYTQHKGGTYDEYRVTAPDGREWKFVSDASIITKKKNNGRIAPADSNYSVELVSPILKFEDIGTLQELVRRLRKAGALADSAYRCGIHIHIDAKNHTPNSLKNLINLMASKEEIIYKSFEIDPLRINYCKKVNETILEAINKKKPKTLQALADIWYANYRNENRSRHYHDSRYHALNLHSVFTKGTAEFRLFNSTMHAGKIRAYLIFCLAISHQALTQKTASPRRTHTDNEKYTFRCWLLRLGLIGEEFKNCRSHLMANLKGNSAWRRVS
jgi:hypothetical protein